MSWLVIIRMILEIIAMLPKDADDATVASVVETAVRDCATVAGDEVSAQSGSDWEALIPHIIAIVQFILKKFVNR
jgi:hypothetical protein